MRLQFGSVSCIHIIRRGLEGLLSARGESAEAGRSVSASLIGRRTLTLPNADWKSASDIQTFRRRFYKNQQCACEDEGAVFCLSHGQKVVFCCQDGRICPFFQFCCHVS
jgi:hypothetical protein